VMLTERDPVPIVIEGDLLSGCIFPKRAEYVIFKFPILSTEPREGSASLKMSLAHAAKKGL
jgi:hypothetical protein